MINGKITVSFRCFYEDGSFVSHYQDLDFFDIYRWLSSYRFTHPGCTRISVQYFVSMSNDDLLEVSE